MARNKQLSLIIISVLLGTFLEVTDLKAPPPPEPIVVMEEEIVYNVTHSYRTRVTAYTSREEETDSTPFITASNSHVRWGIVATNAYPFGTLVRFPDKYPDQIFVVEDRMNKRYHDEFDIWFPEYGPAIKFGDPRLKVEILEQEVIGIARVVGHEE